MADVHVEPPPAPAEFPDRMNVFLTSEHFTLQSGRSIINGEINNRVAVYFTTLSGLLIASGFLAQLPEMNLLLVLFAWIAFPVMVVLGFFTFARIMVLGYMDTVYIRAINRVRQFYVRAAPEARPFLLFPPHDDARSTQVYGGYDLGWRGNLLAIGSVVVVINSLVVTVLASTLINWAFGPGLLWVASTGAGIFVGMFVLHTLVAWLLVRPMNQREYEEVRFPMGGEAAAQPEA